MVVASKWGIDRESFVDRHELALDLMKVYVVFR